MEMAFFGLFFDILDATHICWIISVAHFLISCRISFFAIASLDHTEFWKDKYKCRGNASWIIVSSFMSTLFCLSDPIKIIDTFSYHIKILITLKSITQGINYFLLFELPVFFCYCMMIILQLRHIKCLNLVFHSKVWEKNC